MDLPIGHNAHLQALKTRPDLNGTIVNIVRYDGDRIIVKISTTEEFIRVKQESLCLIEPELNWEDSRSNDNYKKNPDYNLYVKIPMSNVVQPTIAKVNQIIKPDIKVQLYNNLCEKSKDSNYVFIYKKVYEDDLAKLDDYCVITPLYFKLHINTVKTIQEKKIELGFGSCQLIADLTPGLSKDSCSIEKVKISDKPTSKMFDHIKGLKGSDIKAIPNWTDNDNFSIPLTIEF